MLNTPEIIALLVLALILFGAKKLPELARGLGSGIREFRKATRDVTDELQNAMDIDTAPPRRMSPPPESRTSYGGSESELNSPASGQGSEVKSAEAASTAEPAVQGSGEPTQRTD